MTQHLPLAVDMDGCLLTTDMLMEALAAALVRRPLLALAAPAWLARGGRPLLKQKLAHADLVDIAHLPLREDFVAFLVAQRAAGRALHLVSASDQTAVEAVAKRLGLFDSATGSDGRINLKAKAKRAFLQQRFPGGFVYAGDSRADLKVWPAAAAAIASGADRAVIAALARSSIPLEATFAPIPAHATDWAALLGLDRLWFGLIGLAAAGLAGWPSAAAAVVAIASALASASVLNALTRMASDRRHPTRRDRPLAAGRIGLATAFRCAAGLAVISTLATIFTALTARGL
jgi:phosphoserine phosphatase